MNDGPDEQSLDGLDSDELDLRSMLHQAVQAVEPRDGTLEHLRRAVPARRARKRQAAVGMAAAALFIGTAVPALVHVSNSTGSDVNPSVAGQASQAQGGAGQGKSTDDGHSSAGDDSGKTPDKDKDGDGGDGRTKGSGSGSGNGSSAGADPAATGPVDAPVCTSAQLGATTDAATAPDSAGTVYGGFRVVNVSTAACTVDGPGSVGESALGAADPARIGTARHAAGDAATGLPDPSTESTTLVLQPGAAYAVKFAWVPSETCPSGGSTGGSTGAPSPEPSPSQDVGSTSGATTGGTDTGVTTQLLTADGAADGSVVVTHTAQAGAPSVSATVSGACAGTVYYTGLLAGS
ncbi:hypothetical protein ABT301_36775 [Streptomyces sp. NPDC000987]|uniref:hypothetical protein n=1 Tax=Streptomyces sp. NPDC000987 TaxID=3154374 RepID=UPI00332F5F8B